MNAKPETKRTWEIRREGPVLRATVTETKDGKVIGQWTDTGSLPYLRHAIKIVMSQSRVC